MATIEPTLASRRPLASRLCDVLPPQGAWSDEAYLWLTDHSRRLIEFTDGHVQELPMPTDTHQAVLAFLHVLFRAYIKPRGGVVMFSALRMRIREGKFREPDLLLLQDRSDPRRRDRFWLGADLVVEVVSPDDPGWDLVEKRADYAEGGVPEYWIVDPRDGRVGAARRLQRQRVRGVRRSGVGRMSTGWTKARAQRQPMKRRRASPQV